MSNIVVVASRSIDIGRHTLNPMLTPWVLPGDALFLSSDSSVERLASALFDNPGGYRMFSSVDSAQEVRERTQSMLEKDTTTLVAIWDGESEGTRAAIDVALDAGLAVHVYRVPSHE